VPTTPYAAQQPVFSLHGVLAGLHRSVFSLHGDLADLQHSADSMYVDHATCTARLHVD
jgi:hypothetical protein